MGDQKPRIQICQNSAARNRTLNKQGLLSEEQLRQAELQEERVGYELKQLEAAKKNAQQSTRTQLEGLALEMKTLQKEKSEAARQLDLATTKSDRDGVYPGSSPKKGRPCRKARS